MCMETRALRATDRPWVKRLVSEHFGSPRVVSRGVLHDALALPGVVAERQGVPVGLLLYRLHQHQCEVVVLIAARQRQGIGRCLLAAVQALAHAAGCLRLWLVTTNAHQDALAFYKAVGWRQVAVHRGAVREARRLKPEIPACGADGTPIEDEIEFECLLDSTFTGGGLA
jgi:GNAT superfamily N-acetyltransferase